MEETVQYWKIETQLLREQLDYHNGNFWDNKVHIRFTLVDTPVT